MLMMKTRKSSKLSLNTKNSASLKGSMEPLMSTGASKQQMSMTVPTIYNAGGGAGQDDLFFKTLREGQEEMFSRTLQNDGPQQMAWKAQELRQIHLLDPVIKLRVNVAREDFPGTSADIDIEFVASADQQAWAKFLRDVCLKLDIQFIHSIVDRSDKSPVWRTLRLRPGGEYFVRMRESAAILDVIITGTNPVAISWPITKDINEVKENVIFEEKEIPKIDSRVDKLISQTMTRAEERDLANAFRRAKTPYAVMKYLETFENMYAAQAALAGKEDGEDIYENCIDIVTLHRLCMETLERLAVVGPAPAEIVANRCFNYIAQTIEKFRKEKDIVIIGLKLLAAIVPYLTTKRAVLYDVTLDSILAYAPAAAADRPRKPLRKQTAADSYAASLEAMSAKNALKVGINSSPKHGGVKRGASKGAEEYSLPDFNFKLQGVSEHGDVQNYMLRYGDFYGGASHKPGAPCLEFVQSTDPLAISNGRGVNEIFKDINALHEEKDEGPKEDEFLTTPLNSTQDAPKAIIGARSRYDKTAAKQAYDTAFGTKKTDSEGEGGSRPNSRQSSPGKSNRKTKFVIKARTDSDDASNNDEDKRQWSRNVGVIGKKAPKKVTDVKIDFKKKNANLSFEDMVGGAEDEENVAVGAMPVVAGDVSGIGGPPAGLAPVEEAVAVKMPTRKELVATLAASGDAIHAPVAVTRRKKGRFHLRPLPTVKCSIFRGLSDPRNRDLVMKQAFALIFKIVSFSYGNREFVFQHGILEEISEIACLCQSLPQLLDYYIWIVDQVYSDGYGDEQNIVEELKDIDVIPLSVEPSMLLSKSVVEGDLNQASTAVSEDISAVDPMAGRVFEAISEMSMPSIDIDHKYREEQKDPAVVMHDRVIPRPKSKTEAELIAAAKEREEKALREKEEDEFRRKIEEEEEDESKDGTDSIVGSLKPLPVTMAKIVGGPELDGSATKSVTSSQEAVVTGRIPKRTQGPGTVINTALKSSLGLNAFDERYTKAPADIIVTAVSMVATMCEINERERQLASRWLDVWEDGSRNFRLAKRKGRDLCGI